MNPRNIKKLQQDLNHDIAELKKVLDKTRTTFDLGEVQGKLDDLFTATSNHLRNEWPAKYNHLAGAPLLLRIKVNLAQHTYNAIRFLVADQRLKEPEWRWPIVFALPAMNRVILDLIFNFVFLFEDFDHSWYWYCQSGYREVVEEITRCRDAALPLPGWKEWIDLQIKSLDLLIHDFNIPNGIVLKPKRVRYWLNPGKMVTYPADTALARDNRKFFQYLNDVYYRELSSQAHGGFRGLSNFGHAVMYNSLDKEEKGKLVNELFPTFRSIQISRTIIFSLSLLTEINYFFKFGLELRLLELWWRSGDHLYNAKEMFEVRYKHQLPYIPINT